MTALWFGVSFAIFVMAPVWLILIALAAPHLVDAWTRWRRGRDTETRP